MTTQQKQPPPQFALVIKEMSSGLLTNGIAYILPDKLDKAKARFLELAKLALQQEGVAGLGGWTPRFLLVTADVATEMRLLTAATQAAIEEKEAQE